MNINKIIYTLKNNYVWAQKFYRTIKNIFHHNFLWRWQAIILKQLSYGGLSNLLSQQNDYQVRELFLEPWKVLPSLSLSLFRSISLSFNNHEPLILGPLKTKFESWIPAIFEDGIQNSNLNPRKMVGIQDSNLVFKGPNKGWKDRVRILFIIHSRGWIKDEWTGSGYYPLFIPIHPHFPFIFYTLLFVLRDWWGSLSTSSCIFEPTCAHARWALMHRFPSVRHWTKSTRKKIISWERLNIQAPNLVRAWTWVTPRSTLKVKVIGQGHQVKKCDFRSDFTVLLAMGLRSMLHKLRSKVTWVRSRSLFISQDGRSISKKVIYLLGWKIAWVITKVKASICTSSLRKSRWTHVNVKLHFLKFKLNKRGFLSWASVDI